MQHSRHVGKVVVSLDGLDEPVPVERRPAPLALEPNGTYLVTGGVSGFGAATARHLADRGARHLALVSRRGADAPEAPALLAALKDRGVWATAYAADCADPDAMARIADRLAEGGHPLRGVVHAAMHLDDEELTELTDERLAAVLAPKVAGGLVLDGLARDADVFCVYSSVAAALGNIRQAGYAAGNLFLEALVRRRRREGAAGLAVAWGAIGDAGYVARSDLGDFLDSVGFETIGSAEALAALDELLAANTDVAVAGRFAWTRAGRFYRTARAPRLGALVPAGEVADQTAEELRTLLTALPPDEALIAVAEQLAKEVATVMHIDPERLDHHRRLDDYGLDSLMTAELITSLSGRFDVEISPMDLLNSGGTIAGLAEALLLYLGICDRGRS